MSDARQKIEEWQTTEQRIEKIMKEVREKKRNEKDSEDKRR